MPVGGNKRNGPKPNVTLDVEHGQRMEAFREAYAAAQSKEEMEQVRKEELAYHMKTVEILFSYYESFELEQQDVKNSQSKQSILDFFKTQKKSTTKRDPYCRATLFNKYRSKVNDNYADDYLPQEPVEHCPNCKSEERKTHMQDGFICCKKCGVVEFLITDSEKPSYKEPPKEVSYFSYARINHFQEWLNHIQGKESTNISEEVFAQILGEIKKQRITDMKQVTYKKMREILKTLRINKYEHIPYIINRITGIANPHFSPELEEKLRNMFIETQVPYLIHSPKTRKNFLSYSYTLYKLLEILGETQYLKYFSLHKSRPKVFESDQTWQKICKDLNWTFYSSI